VLNAFRQVGGAIGIAVMGAIVAATAGGERSVDAFMRGYERALMTAAAIALIGAVVAGVLVRSHLPPPGAAVAVDD
jgi:DHA2 family methylenomycin A resistance protein-like MFS transporter